jgi:hypothetical protein
MSRRDATIPDVTQAIAQRPRVLLVANRDNPKALGDLGYTVDDSPPGWWLKSCAPSGTARPPSGPGRHGHYSVALQKTSQLPVCFP